MLVSKHGLSLSADVGVLHQHPSRRVGIDKQYIQRILVLMPSSRKYDVQFFTATIWEWRYLLADDRFKDIISDSIHYLVKNNRIKLHGYVIMNNHLHLIWHIIYPHKREDVQRDFLKFTAQMIIKDLRNSDPHLLQELYVGAKDRKYQVWERNPLTVEIWTEDVLKMY